MKQATSVELNRTDLGTWLGRMACQLRNHGLAIMGRASLGSSPGEHDYEDQAELCTSLERAASLLETVRARLCKDCGISDVLERVTFGPIPEARERSIRKGDKNHEQEERKGREAGRRKKARGRQG